MHSTDNELLAVVNDVDVVIGAMKRREIHHKGLRHRAVHILVFDGEGRLCLQKRAMTKDVNPGAWDSSAAGHVDFGESYEAAAQRELMEELGITAEAPLISLGRIDASETTGWEFVEVFAIRYIGTVEANPGEIDALKWVTPLELETLLSEATPTLTRSFRRVWQRFESSKLMPALFT